MKTLSSLMLFILAFLCNTVFGQYTVPTTIPTENWKITGTYGGRLPRIHKGLDLDLQNGDPVRASAAGTVTRVRFNPGGYGWYVDIDHGNGVVTRYAHLRAKPDGTADVVVVQGNSVQKGQVIGAHKNVLF